MNYSFHFPRIADGDDARRETPVYLVARKYLLKDYPTMNLVISRTWLVFIVICYRALYCTIWTYLFYGLYKNFC